MGKMGRAIGLASALPVLGSSSCAKVAVWGHLGDSSGPAGMKDQRRCCAHGIKTKKEFETLDPDDATASSSPRLYWWEDQLKSIVEIHFVDKETWVQCGEGTYLRTAISSCCKALLMSPVTFPYFEERSSRSSIM